MNGSFSTPKSMAPQDVTENEGSELAMLICMTSLWSFYKIGFIKLFFFSFLSVLKSNFSKDIKKHKAIKWEVIVSPFQITSYLVKLKCNPSYLCSL